MSTRPGLHRAGLPTSFRSEPAARRLVVGLYAPYFALNVVFPGALVVYAGGFLCALVALLALRMSAASISLEWVRPRWPSRAGIALLAPLLLLIPASAIVGRLEVGSPGDVLGGLVSATAQELYFRGALLSVLARWLGESRGLRIQAFAFGGWHARAFLEVAPPLAPLVVLATAVGGQLMGLQVRRDRTVAATVVLHATLLAVQ